MNFNLTPNGLQQLRIGDKRKDVTLQVLSVISVKSKGKDRYKVNLSDGINTSKDIILAAAVLPLVNAGRVSAQSVIRVTEATVNKIKNKEIVLIMGFDVLGNPGVVIGNPSSNEGARGPQQQQQHFGNQQRQQQYQNNNRQRNTGGSGGGSDNISRDRIYPIESLDEYSSGWTIKARVTQKGDVRTWNRNDKSGRLMSVDLVDDSGEIRAVMFNDVVDKLGNILEQGRVFYIKGGRLKEANTRFNHLGHKCEITFNDQTIVQPAEEDASLPTVKINAVPIASLSTCQDNSNVDVLGIIKAVGELVQGRSEKSNKDYTKRNVTVCDNSDGKQCVDITLWGEQAQNFNFEVGQVVAVTKCRKSSFNNVTLSARSFSQIVSDPSLPQAANLLNWYQNGGSEQQSTELTATTQSKSRGGAKPRVPLADTQHPEYFDQRGNAYFTVRCTVTQFANRDLWYDSCPGEGCRKKVTLGEDGMYHCQTCQGTFDHSEKRYVISVKLSDYSGHIWATAFEEQGHEMFGCTANELASFKGPSEEETEEYDALVSAAKFKEYGATIKVTQQDPSAQFTRNPAVQKIWQVSNRGDAYLMSSAIDKVLAAHV
mmetsp:Transcript_8710/g.32158  ORF Transcript_8710/g.32158 Transcript_8710/m.32158 type:complete len:598 (-) Transcript_8710:86-1879(-)